MIYILRPTKFFLHQLDELSEKSRRILGDKFRLLKQNPFRYKQILGYNLFLFKVRFEDNQKEKRLIYLVDKPYIKILCILDRDKGYKDLKNYLGKLD